MSSAEYLKSGGRIPRSNSSNGTRTPKSAEYLKRGGRTASSANGSNESRTPKSYGGGVTRNTKSAGRAAKVAKPDIIVPDKLLKPNILTMRVQIGIGKRSKMLVSEV